jgi:hypothetical protein
MPNENLTSRFGHFAVVQSETAKRRDTPGERLRRALSNVLTPPMGSADEQRSGRGLRSSQTKHKKRHPAKEQVYAEEKA